MKLIKETVLRYKEGNSDKVYKVLLLEISPDKYFVNFAFGKFESILKEGTKTESPISLKDATRIFNDLVESKTSKGYIENFDYDIENNTSKQQNEYSKDSDKQIKEILNILENNSKISFFKSTYNKLKKPASKSNKLSRAIWRAGELQIKEAKQYLLNLLSTEDDVIKYSVIWSLGYCGDNICTTTLLDIYYDTSTSDMIKRITLEALIKISDIEIKENLIYDVFQSLPLSLKEIYKTGKIDNFIESTKNYILDPSNAHYLESLYYIDNEDFKVFFAELLKSLPLKAPYFKYLRHIFKIAEYRFDPLIYGILARKFDKEKYTIDTNNYKWKSDWGYYYTESGYIKSSEIKKQIKSSTSKFAFTSKTKHYMIRRVNRFFRKLGRDENNNFVKMAVGVLLAYSDQDSELAKTTSKTIYDYKTRKYSTITKTWDKFASSLVLNYLLYSNSTRYLHNENSRGWHCINDYSPGDKLPLKREELYPDMWDKVPEGLVHLIIESNCSVVHEFAVKALKDNLLILDNLDNETLILLLQKPYKSTSELAFSILKTKFDPFKPDILLINILINSISEEIRNQAIKWIKMNPDFYFNDIDFTFSLMINEFSDIREFVKNQNIKFSDQQNKSIVAKLISFMLTKVDNYNKSNDISDNLKSNYKNYLTNIGVDIIKDLLSSSSEASQELGVFILMNHNTKIVNMPYELLELVINSDFESVRSIGVQLISQLPLETTLLRIPLIMSLVTHKLIDVRIESRTLVDKIITNDAVAEKITEELIKELSNKEKHKNLHEDILFLLQNNLINKLNNLDIESILMLVNSKSSIVQDLGGKLLLHDKNIKKVEKFNLIDIVKLSNHEILSVRQAAWKVITNQAKNIISDKQNLPKVIRLFDSKREDSRNYALNNFSKYFSESDWTPELLIGLCESIYPEIREFGINMIIKMFKSEYAIEYLTKLSESPSTEIQFFATSYLEEYIKNDTNKLKEMIPYFKRVLAHVNKSRTAKNRILNFLNNQYKNNIESAQIVIDIISWYSLTNSIIDKSKAISLMLDISKTYPDLELPLKINEVEVRNAI